MTTTTVEIDLATELHKSIESMALQAGSTAQQLCTDVLAETFGVPRMSITDGVIVALHELDRATSREVANRCVEMGLQSDDMVRTVQRLLSSHKRNRLVAGTRSGLYLSSKGKARAQQLGA